MYQDFTGMQALLCRIYVKAAQSHGHAGLREWIPSDNVSGTATGALAAKKADRVFRKLDVRPFPPKCPRRLYRPSVRRHFPLPETHLPNPHKARRALGQLRRQSQTPTERLVGSVRGGQKVWRTTDRASPPSTGQCSISFR